jgi:hypothetical protein
VRYLSSRSHASLNGSVRCLSSRSPAALTEKDDPLFERSELGVGSVNARGLRVACEAGRESQRTEPFSDAWLSPMKSNHTENP